MTFREKLMKEHPEYIDSKKLGGCCGCPDTYGYEDRNRCSGPNGENCTDCWDREIPEQSCDAPQSSENNENDSDDKIIGESENRPKSDPVNHPLHYTGQYECIDVMEWIFGAEAVKTFCICNAFKYIWRCMDKNGIEDLKKADWYLRKLIELEEGDTDGNP